MLNITLQKNYVDLYSFKNGKFISNAHNLFTYNAHYVELQYLNKFEYNFKCIFYVRNRIQIVSENWVLNIFVSFHKKTIYYKEQENNI